MITHGADLRVERVWDRTINILSITTNPTAPNYLAWGLTADSEVSQLDPAVAPTPTINVSRSSTYGPKRYFKQVRRL